MKHLAARACAALAISLLVGCEIGVEQMPDSADQSTGTSKPPRLVEEPPAMSRTPEGALVPVSPQPGARPAGPARTSRVARGNLRFIEGYRQGYQQAVSESKPMLLFFTAEWCHYCHQMANEAFTHPQVVGLSANFVCVLIDADAEPDVCRQFQITGYPTIQFVSPRGVPLERVVGKQPGHQLMMAMQAALQNVARRGEESDEMTPR